MLPSSWPLGSGKPKCTQSPEPVLSCGVKAAQRVNGPRTESLLWGLSECLLTLASNPINLVPETGKPVQGFQSLAGIPLPSSLKFGAGM